MRNLAAAFLIAALSLLPAAAFAQGQDERESLAAELIGMMQLDAVFDHVTQTVRTQIEADLRSRQGIDSGAIAIVQDIVTDEFDDLRNPLTKLTVELMLEYYDLDDLKTMIAFYSTPTGQKAIRIAPELTSRIVVLNTKLMQDMQPRLQRRINDELGKAGYRQ